MCCEHTLRSHTAEAAGSSQVESAYHAGDRSLEGTIRAARHQGPLRRITKAHLCSAALPLQHMAHKASTDALRAQGQQPLQCSGRLFALRIIPPCRLYLCSVPAGRRAQWGACAISTSGLAVGTGHLLAPRMPATSRAHVQADHARSKLASYGFCRCG